MSANADAEGLHLRFKATTRLARELSRITIYMDDAIFKRFKAQSEKSGKG